MHLRRFFRADEGPVSGQLRMLTGTAANRLLLLDVADDGAFYAYGEDVEDDVSSKKVRIEGLTHAPGTTS